MNQDSLVGYKPRRRCRNSVGRLFGAVALASVLAVSGATLASAEPSASPSTTEEAVEPPSASGAPTASVAPTTTPESQTGTPTLEALAAGRVNTVQNRVTWACLDDSSLGLRGFPCNGLDFQRWNFTLVGDVYYRVQNISNGRCLDHSDAYGLRTLSCNGGGYQLWSVLDLGNGIELRNAQSGSCLDDSNLGVRAIGCNGGQYQRWNLY